MTTVACRVSASETTTRLDGYEDAVPHPRQRAAHQQRRRRAGQDGTRVRSTAGMESWDGTFVSAPFPRDRIVCTAPRAAAGGVSASGNGRAADRLRRETGSRRAPDLVAVAVHEQRPPRARRASLGAFLASRRLVNPLSHPC